MSLKRKALSVLTITALILLTAVGLNERQKQSQRAMALFSEIVSLTDNALVNFSEVDERWLGGKETDENYQEAWYDLNFRLEEVKKLDDRLKNPPGEIKAVLRDFRAGFYRVLSVTNNVVDFLTGEADNPEVIIKNRETFEEGLEMLKEVKDKLKPPEKTV